LEWGILTRPRVGDFQVAIREIKHPAYDLFYLILARRNNACILTKDKKMIEAASKLNIKVTTA
jgi:predicted nucleic acid-binding protein